jgi:hypothetical protein
MYTIAELLDKSESSLKPRWTKYNFLKRCSSIVGHVVSMHKALG